MLLPPLQCANTLFPLLISTLTWSTAFLTSESVLGHPPSTMGNRITVILWAFAAISYLGQGAPRKSNSSSSKQLDQLHLFRAGLVFWLFFFLSPPLSSHNTAYQTSIVIPKLFIRSKSISKSRLMAALPRTGPDNLTFFPGQELKHKLPLIRVFCWCSGCGSIFNRCSLLYGFKKSYKSYSSGKSVTDRKLSTSEGMIQLILKLV